MTNWYVSSLAVGGGDGSEGTPWTLAEAIAKVNDSTVADGDFVNIKADGTYIGKDFITTRAGSQTGWLNFRGYSSTILDNGIATSQAEGNHSHIIGSVNGYQAFYNLKVDSNGFNGDGIRGTYYAYAYNCEATGSTSGFGIYFTGSAGVAVNCYMHDNPYGGACFAVNCIIKDCTTAGLSPSAGAINSVFDNCVIGSHPNHASSFSNCIFINNTQGINLVRSMFNFTNCHFGNNTDAFLSSGTRPFTLNNCNFYNNGSDYPVGLPITFNETALDPQFNDTPNMDYTTNLGDVKMGLARVKSISQQAKFSLLRNSL